MNRICVIGGGAAGMMAAMCAAEAGARVTLVEKNEKLGKKVYITGKGRCNVTNHCSREEFFRNVIRNPRFLYSAFEVLSPEDLMDRLERLGCPLTEERGNRVFPASNHASDITRTFEKELRRLGVDIRLNTRVSRLMIREGICSGVLLAGGEELPADRVILATGGMSYSSTGSTGDGWQWLQSAGHRVEEALPSLVGLCCEEEWVHHLQGLSLKNVRLTLRRGKKTIYTELGEMLFTHFGYSGPLMLSASSYLSGLSPEDAALTLNLKPGLTAEQLDARMVRDITASPRKQLTAFMSGLLPAKLGETVATLCGLDVSRPCCTLTREERQALVRLLNELPLPWCGLRPLEEAIVTRGGVCVKEINPSTMESRLISGLYVAGEMLDVDALTGGFNLQIAFSTGALAGISAAAV